MQKSTKGNKQKMLKEAVLLLNIGGPNSLYEVDVFLKNMFNDPCILSIKNNFLRKMIANFIVSKRSETSKTIYRAIGGKSPIAQITFSLIQKLQHKDPHKIYTYAMRYVPPYILAVLQDLQKQGVNSLTLFSMYPQYSTTTTLSSFNEVYRSLEILDYKPTIKLVERFYKNNTFNECIATEIEQKMQGKDPNEFTLIFSAHGLPQSIIDKGDSYQEECEEHRNILKKILRTRGMKFDEVLLTYQSKVGPLKWIGPDTYKIVQSRRDKKVIIYPLSFTIDNSETLYELCIQYAKLAQNSGVRDYIVCECPNVSDIFVQMILESCQINDEFSLNYTKG